MKYTKLVAQLFLFLILLNACKDSGTGGTEDEVLEPSLRNSPTYPVGYAIQRQHLNNRSYIDLLREQSSSISAEYEMKMSPMYNDPNAINYDVVDEIVDFAELSEIRVHGHALLWHSAVPSWIQNYNGTDAEFESIIENYVKDVVGRYKGRIASWDVVNEAFDDGAGNPLRNSVFRQKMGDDYIEKVFRWAREADPDVLLFYNDYNMVANGSKLEKVIAMADDFLERGVPIDGIGFQMHISYDWPSETDIISATNKVTSRGLKIHYSELDIRVNPNATATSYNAELAQRLVNRSTFIFNLYKSLPEETQFGITWWGVKDNDSWLRDFWENPNEWPLLFNDDFEPKDAVPAIIDIFE
tara:strand:+ start:15853 stop:16920 length:1068 start_codon:yes stop_codon:yes gene_type:complete